MKFAYRVGRQLRQPTGFWGRVIAKLMNLVNKEMYVQAHELLELKPNDVILEIGFGNGAYIPEMVKAIQPGKYYGADISETMVKSAAKRNELWIKKGKVKLFLANAAKLPLEDNSVTKVVTINTIYFWENPPQVMAEVKRVLKPGGKFIVALNSKDAMKNSQYVQEVFTLYNKESVVELFEKSSFQVGRITHKKMKVEDVLCVEGILS